MKIRTENNKFTGEGAEASLKMETNVSISRFLTKYSTALVVLGSPSLL